MMAETNTLPGGAGPMSRFAVGCSRLVERHGVTVFVAACAIYLLAASMWAEVLPSTWPSFHLDLRVFRAGAQAFLDGTPLYAHNLPIAGADSMPFTYPPIAAVLFIPLTWFSVNVAGIIWTLLAYAALTVSLYLTVRCTGRSRRNAFLIAVVGMCLATTLIPIWATLSLGQIGIFLMLLVVVDIFVLERRGRPRGLLIGLAAAIKLTPAGFVLLVLLRRDWKMVLGIGVGFAAATGLGAALDWHDTVAYWTSLPQASGRVQVFAGVANISLAGVANRMAHGTASTVIWLVLCLIAVALGVIAMRRQLSVGDLAMATMLNAVLILLVSPVSWNHHWVWIAPLLVLLALAAIRDPWRAGLVLVVSTVLFVYEPAGPLSWARWVAWGMLFLAIMTRLTFDSRPARTLGSTSALDSAPTLGSTSTSTPT